MNNNNKFLWRQTMIRRVNRKSERADACSGMHGYHKGTLDGDIISVNKNDYLVDLHPVDEINAGWNEYQRDKRMERLNPRIRNLLKFFRVK